MKNIYFIMCNEKNSLFTSYYTLNEIGGDTQMCLTLQNAHCYENKKVAIKRMNELKRVHKLNLEILKFSTIQKVK